MLLFLNYNFYSNFSSFLQVPFFPFFFFFVPFLLLQREKCEKFTINSFSEIFFLKKKIFYFNLTLLSSNFSSLFNLSPNFLKVHLIGKLLSLKPTKKRFVGTTRKPLQIGLLPHQKKVSFHLFFQKRKEHYVL